MTSYKQELKQFINDIISVSEDMAVYEMCIEMIIKHKFYSKKIIRGYIEDFNEKVENYNMSDSYYIDPSEADN